MDLSHIADEKLRDRVLRMLAKYEKMWDEKLGRIGATDHRIDLKPEARAAHQMPYRQGWAMREKAAKQVQDHLKMGFLEPASSEWASPVVFAPNSDGTLRFCVDYRGLNEATLAVTYPSPRMDDCIDSLEDSKVFTTLDANCGYWQIPISASDRDKTCFTTHMSTYR